MNVWGRLPLLVKIGLGFFALLSLTIVIALLGQRMVRQTAAVFDDVIHVDAVATIEAARMDMLIDEAEGAVWLYLLEQDQATLIEMDEIEADWLAGYDVIRHLVREPDEKAMLEEMHVRQQAFFALGREMMQAAADGELERALAMRPGVMDAADAATSISMDFIDVQQDKMDRAAQRALDDSAQASSRIWLATGAADVVGLVMSVALARHIALPVRAMATMAGRIADGDLTVEALHIRQRDETGRVAEAFNVMAGRLRDMIGRLEATVATLRENSVTLPSGSRETAQVTEQIAAAIAEVAAGTSEQSQSVQEVSTALSEVEGVITRVGTGAHEQGEAVKAT